MRLKKGSKVEVLSTKDVPSGSWFTAQIISGNGRHYFVSFDHCRLGEIEVQRVSRKLIRPCPPDVHLAKPWGPGNIVEVFHNGSWKLAHVSGVFGQHYYIVRLLGSSENFQAHRSSLRVRLIWQDHKWTVIKKDSRQVCSRPAMGIMPGIEEPTYHLPRSCMGANDSTKEHLMEPASTKNLKKRPLPPDECSGTGRKTRVGENGRRLRAAGGCSVELRQKGQNQRL